MNGAQDLGGMMGFGPVLAEPDEPVFHVDWEKRVLALTLAAGALGEWNIDMSRHARESLHPVDYLSSSYYEVWLAGLRNFWSRMGSRRQENSQKAERSGGPNQQGHRSRRKRSPRLWPKERDTIVPKPLQLAFPSASVSGR